MSAQTWQPQSPTILMTDSAVAYLQNQITKKGHGIGLRLGVKKSGCSGLKYITEIIDAPEATDHVFPVATDKVVVVAPKDLPYVQGTRIDFVTEGLNKYFKFINPNMTGSCGCGESFSVTQSEL